MNYILETHNLTKTHGSAKDVKRHKLKNLIFLPYSGMCVKYPFLKKLPILLPVMWVVRIFTAVLFKRATIKKQNDHVNVITAEGVDSYQQALSFVGLDFNFKE